MRAAPVLSAETPSFQPAQTHSTAVSANSAVAAANKDDLQPAPTKSDPNVHIFAAGQCSEQQQHHRAIERDRSAPSGLTNSSSGEATLFGGITSASSSELHLKSHTQQQNQSSRAGNARACRFEGASRDKERAAIARERERGGGASARVSALAAADEDRSSSKSVSRVDLATSLMNYKRKTAAKEGGGVGANGTRGERERHRDRDGSSHSHRERNKEGERDRERDKSRERDSRDGAGSSSRQHRAAGRGDRDRDRDRAESRGAVASAYAGDDLVDSVASLRMVPRGAMGERGGPSGGKLFDPDAPTSASERQQQHAPHRSHHSHLQEGHQHAYHHRSAGGGAGSGKRRENRDRDRERNERDEFDRHHHNHHHNHLHPPLPPSGASTWEEEQRPLYSRTTYDDDFEPRPRTIAAAANGGNANASTVGGGGTGVTGGPGPNANANSGTGTTASLATTTASSAAGSAGGTQLFDPRRHDPVKFAAMQKRAPASANGGGSDSKVWPSSVSSAVAGPVTSTSGQLAVQAVGTITPTSFSDARSLVSSSLASKSTGAASVTSSEASRERRRRRGGASSARSGGGGGGQTDASPSAPDGNKSERDAKSRGTGGAGGGGGEVNSYVMDLKRAYRDISQLEQKLQEDHKAAVEKRNERSGAQLLDAGFPSGIAVVMAGANSGAGGGGAGNPTGTSSTSAVGAVDHEAWLRLIAQHRQLAELHEAFMEMVLRPGLPASLHSLPQNYNIPTRLWQTGFHIMLERLRHALPYPQPTQQPTDEAGTAAQAQLLDHLTEFIYFAYAFYSNLLESEILRVFKSAWIESLGDLARYRMAVAGLSAALNRSAKNCNGGVRNKARRVLVRQQHQQQSTSVTEAKITNLARIDDEDNDEGGSAARPPPHVAGLERASIGSDALGDWELEEKETWRITARDWYAKGLADMPGTGRLHHHLGILSRNEELRALHHFCRSLTASHPFLSARESMLPLFDPKLQSRRQGSDASLTDLFVCMHGMIITRVQLDDFEDVFQRFLFALQDVDPSGRSSPDVMSTASISSAEWMMMATANVAAILQHGAEDAIFATATDAASQESQARKTERIEAKTPTAIILSQNSKVSSPPSSPKIGMRDAPENTIVTLQKKSNEAPSDEDLPLPLRCALRLAFTSLRILIVRWIKSRNATINPYLTIILTFLATVAKQTVALGILERWVPWEALTQLAVHAPHPIDPRKDMPSKITGIQPLPEDWCLRGMAWVGRRVYERGFWKPPRAGISALKFESEVDVLTREQAMGETGWGSENVTSEGDDDQPTLRADSVLTDLRWKRLLHTLMSLAKTVPGLDFDERTQSVAVVNPLRNKIERWAIEEKEVEAIETSPHIRKFDVDSDEEADSSSERESDEDADDGNLPEEIRVLKARHRYLKSVIQQAKSAAAPLMPTRTKQDGQGKKEAGRKPGRKELVNVVPGYTVLVLDTNVLIAPGKLLEQLVEWKRWTIIIPLAVVTELDGLQKNPEPLGPGAQRALAYIEKNIRSCSKWLKVQTSRGNYLADLTVRQEEIDFGNDVGDDVRARSLDEIILRVVNWQQTHFMDRLAILSDNPSRDRERIKPETTKAVLVTLDRNLRLKARGKGLSAATQKEITHIFLAHKAPNG
ncbi:hypothetical protein K437DRAFT_83968 [Tilletiaria anomala UBC 951]|uniref:PIN domain-containing protein n=1 Tax=Tilletiaria anomala (strain ATCC 24038 / CBS 436.72 / UBC 951) TaxID=1037660 RepID=A0A066W7L2_TILAU|nr:uncharacterized protein K437DRAFT_83968 [Tilletiaria anomala UBC 951]KDN48528.1 hypothetical protein K437DRAFT_83968 [Tilletiaria anomala UBC 951]